MSKSGASAKRVEIPRDIRNALDRPGPFGPAADAKQRHQITGNAAISLNPFGASDGIEKSHAGPARHARGQARMSACASEDQPRRSTL
jgi:hypothetical protein